MAKTKAELLEDASALGISAVTEKNTVSEIKEAIATAESAGPAISDETPAKEEASAQAAETEAAAFTKAGKRSKKAVQEADEEAERQARIESGEEAEKPKQKQNPPKPRSERRSKGYKASAEKLDVTKHYSLAEAAELATKTSHVKFDASVELHVRLNVDPKQADQNIRDTIVLPAGTGKTVRVAVFADDEDVTKAQAAGADIAANDSFLQQLDKGTIDFDVLIATPAMMAKLGKYARVLGPKGLMPNPKSGTVTADVAKAVKEAKAGKLEYRVDSTGIIHTAVGKVSFGKDKLLKNLLALTTSIKNNKPSSVKGVFVRSAYVTTSMGPSIKVDISEIQ